MEIAELLRLAELTRAGGLGLEEELARIENFCTALGGWLENDLDRVGSGEQGLLEQLAQEHEVIMKRVAGLKAETSGEMMDFQKRSRAIISYIDRFPKKISVLRSRKG